MDAENVKDPNFESWTWSVTDGIRAWGVTDGYQSETSTSKMWFEDEPSGSVMGLERYTWNTILENIMIIFNHNMLTSNWNRLVF